MSNAQLPPPTELVTQLNRLSHESIRKDPKTSSHLYLAALGLLTCLKSEQAKIRVAASKKEPCPPPADTPVMTAVRQDARLLSSLLKCLKTPPPDRMEDTPHPQRKTSMLALGVGLTAAGRGPGSNFHQRGRGRGGRGLGRGQPSAGRKRLMSEDFSKPNKTPKLNLSPGPKSKRGPFMSATPSMKTRQDSSQMAKPEFSLQPIVCTILFASFMHLDHWPSALVAAYAEDSFGPRLWVDDERCKGFCQNLSLAHLEAPQEAEPADGQILSDADGVLRFYDSLLSNVPPLTEDEKPTTTLLPAERMRSRSEAGVDLSKVPLLNGDDSDSDSGEEEIVEESTSISVGNIPSVDLSVASKVTKTTDADNSSSSGEEEEIEEEGIGNSSSFENPQKRPPLLPGSSYPLSPSQPLNLTSVRQRYFGENLSKCHSSIESALIERLEQKTKQNAKLLQVLPEYTAVPAVRRIAAKHLGKWLQHPGLSMEARKVFKSTVANMKTCSPPLDDDLDAINDILEMELKANLLNDHIEGITKIVRRIPSTEVAQHVFLKLLRDELNHLERDPQQALNSDHLKKINAVHSALPDGIESDGLGTAILKLLLDRDGLSTDRIRLLIRRLSASLGSRLDCCKLIESLISFDVPSEHWTLNDEEDRGRVLLECMCQLVPLPENSIGEGRGKQSRRHHGNQVRKALSADVTSKLRKKLRDARKFLVSWCCNDYGSLLDPSTKSTASLHEAIVKRTLNAKATDTPVSAGPPDFTSILDGRSERSNESTCPDTIKCILLMVEPGSPEMASFLGKGERDSDQDYRLRQCYEYGADLDTDSLWIVLEAAQVRHSISSKRALVIIEHLFWCCNKRRKATLNVNEPRLISELYKLAEFVPQKRPKPDADEPMDTSDGSTAQNGNSPSIPKLAHPGLWWRVTSILLVLSGADPHMMGAALSEEYPTLLALIKMATSGRYRFPTVDCDDELRDRMKKEESKMREEEARVAELLFLPPLPKTDKKKAQSVSPKRGARASARQRERQDKLRKQKLAKEAAEAAAAAAKRKKLLKAAQKTIMVWDPKSPARKPPRESVDLILSVERLFGLSKAFQDSTQPDFVMLSVGQTTRDAIERASSWLIPVISSLPSIIGRLPASSSCYLLLQAYGGAGEKARGMKELSAPLLEHVSKTVVGEYGQKDSLSAVKLLLTDVADKRPERRRCARRVFQETLSDLNAKVQDRVFDEQGHTWLLGLLLIEHASSLVADAIELISLALSYERGSFLRALVLSLERYQSFAASNGIKGEWSLPATLCHLVADRPITFSAAIEKYPDLRDLVISVIHGEFRTLLKQEDTTEDDDEDYVEMKPSRSFERPADMTADVVKFPLDRLESIFVLLSIWADEGTGQERSKKSIGDFANFLLLPDAKVETEDMEGISGAVFAGTSQAAVTVSQWVMLAKSKSNDIARRAALSAPTRYLPRLLLCSGLPRASLLTMIDRLGILGEEAKDKTKSFRELFMPSAMSDWGISHVGGRKDVARKLLGRLASYLSDVNIEEEKISTTFLVWLNGECQGQEKSKKPGTKKRSRASKPTSFEKLATVSSVLQSIDGADEEIGEGLEIKSSTKQVELSPTFAPSVVVGDDFQQRLTALCKDQLFDDIDAMVQSALALGANEDSTSTFSLLKGLLHLGLYSPRSQAPVTRWIPRLFDVCGAQGDLREIWQLLFSARWDDQLGDTVVSLCTTSFSSETVRKCHEWILKQGNDINGDILSLRRIVHFLVSTSGLDAPYKESISKQASNSVSSVLSKRVEEVTSVALRAASWECDEMPMHKLMQRISSRNDVPSWMLLLLQLGRLGKASVSKIVAAILKSISSTQKDSTLGLSLQAITLRLYTLYPTSMSLGNAALRTVLVAASKSVSTSSDWRCPFDTQVNDTLEALKDAQHSPRLIQFMVDLAKSHPLLLLRRLGQMKAVLASDAEAESVARPGVRTRVHGESLPGPLTATGPDGRPLKVKLRHWGYAFTDPLWVGLLEILMSVPREVLFDCGMAMGLSQVLLEYVKLLFVQSGLNNKDRASRLRGRFADFLHLMEETSPDSWNQWLAEKDHQGVESVGCTRNMLVTASLLTTEQAIANIRSRGGETKK